MMNRQKIFKYITNDTYGIHKHARYGVNDQINASIVRPYNYAKNKINYALNAVANTYRKEIEDQIAINRENYDTRPGVVQPKKRATISDIATLIHRPFIAENKMNSMWNAAWKRQRELAKNPPGLTKDPKMRKMWDMAKERQTSMQNSRPRLITSSVPGYTSTYN